MTLKTPLVLATYHPETRASISSEAQIEELIAALDRLSSATVLFTGTNADTDGRIINERVLGFCTARPDRRLFVQSLGRIRYWQILSLADAVVGNSSSGIVEAPLLGTPIVNVGKRQEGRIRHSLVIDCLCDRDLIYASILKALASGKSNGLPRTVMPSPAKLMVEYMKKAEIKAFKPFFAIPWGD